MQRYFPAGSNSQGRGGRNLWRITQPDRSGSNLRASTVDGTTLKGEPKSLGGSPAGPLGNRNANANPASSVATLTRGRAQYLRNFAAPVRLQPVTAAKPSWA